MLFSSFYVYFMQKLRFLCRKPYKNNKKWVLRGKLMWSLSWRHPANLALFWRKKLWFWLFLYPCLNTLKDLLHGRKYDQKCCFLRWKLGKFSRFHHDEYHINLCCFPWFMFTLCLKQRFYGINHIKTTKMSLFMVNLCLRTD